MKKGKRWYFVPDHLKKLPIGIGSVVSFFHVFSDRLVLRSALFSLRLDFLHLRHAVWLSSPSCHEKHGSSDHIKCYVGVPTVHLELSSFEVWNTNQTSCPPWLFCCAAAFFAAGACDAMFSATPFCALTLFTLFALLVTTFEGARE